MFMSGIEVKPTRSGRLLSLIRGMIDYGLRLAATLSKPGPGNDVDRLVLPFGTRDIALILARITSGLRLAAALDHRPPAPPHRGLRVRTPTPCHREPTISSPRPSRSPHASAAAPSAPSSPTSAATSASRGNHPLWGEIRDAIVEFGGDFAKLYGEMLNQVLGQLKEPRRRITTAMAPPPASTGPPQQAAA
jgi:hypothetical protein